MSGPSATSPGDSADLPPARHAYREELEQLRLQVELMGVRVDENLERMRQVLADGDGAVVGAALATDDDIDAMNVSLTERCYSILGLESPVAGDLRLVVSVLRVIGELERIGDLALRVIKLAPRFGLLTADSASHDILCVMATEAVERYRLALRAWAALDVGIASAIATPSPVVDLAMEQLTRRIRALSGPSAVDEALVLTTAARAIDRIADHSLVLGARVRYLITGDSAHLAVEVR
jgi:phosphate transport system protein